MALVEAARFYTGIEASIAKSVLEIHKKVAGNGEALRQGMAFSVEPGIYLAGRYGSRIEDIVICGPDGPDPLNESSHHLWVVSG